MKVLDVPGLLGIVALSFLTLLLLKQITSRARDLHFKGLSCALIIGLLALTANIVYHFYALQTLWPHLSNVSVGLVFFIGPALYCYTLHLSGERIQAWGMFHFSPSIVVAVLLIPYFQLPAATKQVLLQNPGEAGTYTTIMQIIWTAVFVQILLYIYLSQPYLRRYRQQVLQKVSSLTLTNLRWLQLFCYGFVTYVLLYLLLPLIGLTSEALVSQILSMTMHLFVMVLAYFAIGSSQLQAVALSAVDSQVQKYTRSSLDSETATKLGQRVEALMSTQQLYLEGRLSLRDLAAQVEINPHNLSQVLNEHLEVNFHDYVNRYRIEHAKNLLLQRPALPVLEVAMASGFNTKNSFNNAFKRHTGMSPSSFRKAAN